MIGKAFTQNKPVAFILSISLGPVIVKLLKTVGQLVVISFVIAVPFG